jgi:hypothetical protein
MSDCTAIVSAPAVSPLLQRHSHRLAEANNLPPVMTDQNPGTAPDSQTDAEQHIQRVLSPLEKYAPQFHRQSTRAFQASTGLTSDQESTRRHEHEAATMAINGENGGAQVQVSLNGTISDKVIELSYESAAGSADSLQLTATRNLTLLTTSLLTLKVGSVYDNATGSTGASGTIAKFKVDQTSAEATEMGMMPLTVQSMDMAGKILSDYKAPVDKDRWSSVIYDNPCTGAGQMIYKTPIVDTDFTADGIKNYSLNSPLIGYVSGARNISNGITRMRLTFPLDQEDGWCTKYAGILIGIGTDTCLGASSSAG